MDQTASQSNSSNCGGSGHLCLPNDINDRKEEAAIQKIVMKNSISMSKEILNCSNFPNEWQAYRKAPRW
jgi:hypothetical protein